MSEKEGSSSVDMMYKNLQYYWPAVLPAKM